MADPIAKRVAPFEITAMRWTRLSVALLWRALISPRTAAGLLQVLWNFRARDWWRRAPFLPLPPREYVRWRMHTAYGDPNAVPPADDVVRYARWVYRTR